MDVVGWLQRVSWGWAFAFFLVENLLIFAGALGVGHLMIKIWGKHRVTPPPPPLEATEVLFAGSTVLLNALVTLGGLWLWRVGVIRLRLELDLWGLWDAFVLFWVMDLAMYVLHRMAHWRFLYPLLHLQHHKYTAPRPLTLFVLNPAEALSFGVLWLMLLSAYEASWFGITIYLTLNVAFGMAGHLGVEFLPARCKELPVVKWLTTSTFHAGHHDGERHNFGFYTLLWDRLFGTLAPDYGARFEAAARGEPLAPRLAPSSSGSGPEEQG